MPSRALGPRPYTTTTQQAGQPQQEGEQHLHSDAVRAEAVQAEAAETGYIPAAVSFVVGKLQVRPSPTQRRYRCSRVCDCDGWYMVLMPL